MINKLKIIGIVLALITIVSVLWGQIGGKQPTLIGSAVDGQTHNATTTDSTWTGAKLVKAGSGTLGSVIFTGVGSSVNSLKIYDATTTNINLRTGNKATSTITIVDFGVSTTRGTYTFDININDGILVEPSVAGGVASTTITYR